VRIGLWLPTFATGPVEGADRTVAEGARRAEELGFDSIWTIDHLLPTVGVHATSWYDPLIALAHAAATTERVELGTASLVAGIRHPIALAKQLASLAALAGPRVALGAGSGWYPPEYEALGYRIQERRGRTDECLQAIRGLLDNSSSAFEGRFWSFEETALVPRPTWHLPILVAGGSRLPEAGSDHDRPTMARSVLERIVAHDGWLAPCAGSEELTLRDLETVRTAVERDRVTDSEFRYAHVQWTYVIDTDDRERALAEQLGPFRELSGPERSPDQLAECYLMGSIADIRARIERMRAAGFDELIIGPANADPEQLELIAEVALQREAGLVS
jgi:alkanesulfonate monooxygenase SsuD/methylene tetrahydromethanopterin reductase-like flavin-dependent oxidoreductase (luciferase family)